MRSMKEINVSQSIGSRCTGSQVVIDLRLALILTPLINTSTFMQARSGSEVKGEECRPWRKVKCSSCASASFISRLQGKQPRRRFDTVLSQQMDRNEIVMWGSTEANCSHAARVGQAWGHPRPLAALPASRTPLLWLVAALVSWSVQLRADAALSADSEVQFWNVSSLEMPGHTQWHLLTLCLLLHATAS